MAPAKRASPPIVLLHGTLGAPASWDAVLQCAPEAVARRAQCLWLPGHGSGRQGRVALSFVHAARGLWRQVQGRSPVVLGGYSLGGRLALAMALLRPERVAGLLLIGAHLGLGSAEARALRRARDRAWADRLREAGLEAFLLAWRAQPIFATQRALARDVLERQQGIARTHAPARLARAIEQLSPGAMPDWTGRLGELFCPAVLMAGALDEKYVQEAQKAASLMPFAQLTLVEGAGHNLLLEQPAAVAEKIALLSTLALQRGQTKKGR